MPGDDHKALIQRFFDEVFNQQSHTAADDVVAAEFVAHHPAFPDGIRGPGGLLQMTAMFHAGFPDLRYEVEDLVAEGDRVAVRWTATGTHRGTFMAIPPTGRAMSITGMDLFRVADGRLAEAWVNSDFLGLLQQLGAIPLPPPS